ncbi:FHA domain-containing protein [Microbacterium sp. NPDC091313]
MTLARYTPGPLIAVAGAGGVALLGGDTAPGVVDAVWELLRGDAGLGELIDLLAAGGSLSAVPPFAVAFDDDGTWRVAARGPFAVTAAEESVEGAGASTWAERSIRSGDALTLSGAPGAPSPDATTARALRDGVVGAAAVTVTRADVAARTTSAAASAPAPAALAAAPAEPVQPHSIREVHDLPAAPAEPEPAAAEPEPAAPAVPAVPAAVPPLPPVPPVPAASAASNIEPGLIDSISVPSARAATPAPTERMPVVDAGEPVGGLDDEVEATIIRDTAPPVGVVEDDKTISLAEARALRATGGLPPVAPPLAPPPPRAVAGVLRVSSGQSVALDRSVIIGRRPRSNRAGGADLPHLIAVDSPQQDISRNHLEVRVEGDTILATDLQTTNGTTLLRAGADPVRLHPTEATVIVVGDVLDLGDGITVAVEAAP